MNKVMVRRVMSREKASALIGATVPVVPASFRGEARVEDEATGECIALVVKMPADMRGSLRRAVLGLHYGSTLRSSMGFGNKSRIFGFVHKKVTQKREGCSQTKLSSEAPEAAMAIAEVAPWLWGVLRRELPSEAATDMATAARVLPEWRIHKDTPWTSGVVNMTSELPYHFDRLNFPIWSAMPVVRRGTGGGLLSMPEYGVALPADDGYALLFRGHKFLHGVTPIECDGADSYRVSVVYYSLAGMKGCASAALEDGLRRQRRTAREASMAAKVKVKP